MFVGYYLLAVFDPYCIVNNGFYDLLDIIIPEGTILRPVRPAPKSCRTHLLGRTLDIIEALIGQRSPQYSAAGYHRGGNAQRTLCRLLAKGEFGVHDD